MNRKHCGPFMLLTFPVVLLLASMAVLSQPLSVARDSILPLKIKVGDKALDFALPSADGKIVRLSDYAGHNVLIDFYRGYW